MNEMWAGIQEKQQQQTYMNVNQLRRKKNPFDRMAIFASIEWNEFTSTNSDEIDNKVQHTHTRTHRENEPKKKKKTNCINFCT